MSPTGRASGSDSVEAAVLVQTGAPLKLMNLRFPVLQPGQVMVDVAYAGICHSQLHEVRGRRGEDRFLPHTLGHEGSGRVTAVGPNVSKVRVGDHVVLTWIRGSGADVPSVKYSGPDGSVNSGAVSTFMRQTIVSENRLVAIPKEMPLRTAALLGCAIPTGAGVVLNSLRVAAGQSVAVFGCGGIGLSALMGAQMSGAAPIIAVDISKSKLELARRAGATHGVDATSESVLPRINELTAGKGVDFAVESAGTSRTMEMAFQSVRDKGGICMIAGNLSHGGRFPVDPMDLIRGKQLRGTWGGETDPDRDLPMYAARILSGELDAEWLITNEYDLAEINLALDDLEAGGIGRAIISMESRRSVPR